MCTAVYSKCVYSRCECVQQCPANVSLCTVVYSNFAATPIPPFSCVDMSLVGAVASIIFVATKVLSSQNMSLVATKLLSQQNFCLDKYLQRNFFLLQQVLLRQKYACQDKIFFVVVTKSRLLLQIFVATRIIFGVTKDIFCHDTRVCHDKHVFVMTKVLL